MKKSKEPKKAKTGRDLELKPIVLDEDAEVESEDHEELDPEVLKVIKPTRKPKVVHDATDYVPELERDTDDGSLGSKEF